MRAAVLALVAAFASAPAHSTPATDEIVTAIEQGVERGYDRLQAKYCFAFGRVATTMFEARSRMTITEMRTLWRSTDLEPRPLAHTLSLVDEVYSGRAGKTKTAVADYAIRHCYSNFSVR